MRIVAGQLKSRKIQTLKGDTSRPSSNKLRAAVYNSMGTYFTQGHVLDLFAGTGAMSFEALSRGFEQATLFEINNKDCLNIKFNIKNLGLENQCTLICGDAMSQFQRMSEKVDLVIMDPPYAYPLYVELLTKIISSNILNDDALILVESDSKKDLPEIILNFGLSKRKIYGGSCIRYYERMNCDES